MYEITLRVLYVLHMWVSFQKHLKQKDDKYMISVKQEWLFSSN